MAGATVVVARSGASRNTAEPLTADGNDKHADTTRDPPGDAACARGNRFPLARALRQDVRASSSVHELPGMGVRGPGP